MVGECRQRSPGAVTQTGRRSQSGHGRAGSIRDVEAMRDAARRRCGPGKGADRTGRCRTAYSGLRTCHPRLAWRPDEALDRPLVIFLLAVREERRENDRHRRGFGCAELDMMGEAIPPPFRDGRVEIGKGDTQT